MRLCASLRPQKSYRRSGVESISTGGHLPIVFHFEKNDMPPVPKGGAVELDIFPMGILLVVSVGKGADK